MIQRLAIPLITVFAVLISFFLYTRFGPSFPVSVLNTNKQDFFTADGTGKVYVKPDMATVQLGYSNSSSNIASAQSQANQTINNVISKLQALGIPESDIKTTNYYISPEYQSGRPEPAMDIQPSMEINSPVAPSKITGYRIDVNLEVKVRDFQKINQVIDTGTANGANQVNSISFSLADPKKYQDEARRKAIDNAKENASAIASEAGITLGKLVNVYVSNQDMPVNYASLSTTKEALDSRVPTEIHPGQTEIVMHATLSYETR